MNVVTEYGLFYKYTKAINQGQYYNYYAMSE